MEEKEIKKRIFCLIAGGSILTLILSYFVIKHILIFYPRIALRIGKPVPVEITKVKYGTMKLTIWGTGIIKPFRRLNYSVDFNGKVKEVLVKEGDIVFPETPLLKIEDTLLKQHLQAKRKALEKNKWDLKLFKENKKREKIELEKNFQAAKENLFYLKKKLEKELKELKKDKKLFEKGFISKEKLEEKKLDVEKVRTNLAQAIFNYISLKHEKETFDKDRKLKLLTKETAVLQSLYDLRQAEKKYEERVIKSTVKGYVAEILIHEGERFTANQELISVGELDPVLARVLIPQELTSFISVGQSAKIFLETWPNKEFIGKVWMIEGEIDSKTKALPVWIKVNNPKLFLKAGLSVHAIIEKKLSGLLIPEIALLGTEDNLYVFVVKKGRAFIQPIKILARNGKYALILSGLSSEEKVVVSGQLYLKNGIKVRENAYQSN